MFLQLVAEVACARLSISADKRNKPASSQIANGRKTAGIEKGRAWKHFFKYVKYQPTFWKTVSRVKMSNFKTSEGEVQEGTGFHMLDTFVHAKPNDWGTCWSELSQLTNHRIGLPERRIENDAYRLHYAVSPQPPRGFRCSFLTIFMDPGTGFGRGDSEKNVCISPTFSFYYLAFRGNKFPRLKDFAVFKIRV